jgi:hypothetical protein
MARLSLPLNPAAELQRLMVEERPPLENTGVSDLSANPSEASIYKYTNVENYTNSPLHSNTDRNIDSYTPATSGNIDNEAVRRVKAMETEEREACNFRLPVGLAERIHRHIGEHYRDRLQKGDLLTRAAMLLCYELETGTQLVDFEDSEAQ